MPRDAHCYISVERTGCHQPSQFAVCTAVPATTVRAGTGRVSWVLLKGKTSSPKVNTLERNVIYCLASNLSILVRERQPFPAGLIRCSAVVDFPLPHRRPPFPPASL